VDVEGVAEEISRLLNLLRAGTVPPPENTRLYVRLDAEALARRVAGRPSR
jgi:hypothetical protein